MSDVDELPDLTLVNQVLGWEPKISLEDGLTRLYQWAGERLSDIEALPPAETASETGSGC